MESTSASVESALLTAVDELYQQLAAFIDSSAVPKSLDDRFDRSDLIRRCAANTREAL